MLTKKSPLDTIEVPTDHGAVDIERFFVFQALTIIHGPLTNQLRPHYYSQMQQNFDSRCSKGAPFCQAGPTPSWQFFPVCAVIYGRITSKWNRTTTRIRSIASKWHWITASSFGSIASKWNGIMAGISSITWKFEWTMARIGRIPAKWHGTTLKIYCITSGWWNGITARISNIVSKWRWLTVIFGQNCTEHWCRRKVNNNNGNSEASTVLEQDDIEPSSHSIINGPLPVPSNITSEELQYWNLLAIAPSTGMVRTLHGDTLGCVELIEGRGLPV